MKLKKEKSILLENKTVQSLSDVVGNWITQIVSNYPSNLDRLLAAIKGNFQPLLPSDIEEHLKPSSIICQASYFSIRIDDLRIKSKKPKECKILFALCGQRGSTKVMDRATFSKKFFCNLSKTKDQVMQVFVLKEDRVKAKVDISLEDFFHREKVIYKLLDPRTSDKMGSITLQVTLANMDKPCAPEVVGKILADFMQRNLCVVFSGNPKHETFFRHANWSSRNNNKIDFGVEIEECIVVEDDFMAAADVNIEVLANGVIQVPVTVTEMERVFRIPVAAFSEDTIQIRRLFTHSNRGNSNVNLTKASDSDSISSFTSRMRKNSSTPGLESLLASNRGFDDDTIKAKNILFKEEMFASDILISQGRSASHGGITWRLKWVPMSVEGGIDMRSSLEVDIVMMYLLQEELRGLSVEERLQWTAEFSDKSKSLLAMIQPFFTAKEMKLNKLRALIQSHANYPFNAYVIYEAVNDYNPNSNLWSDDISMLFPFMVHCAEIMSEVSLPMTSVRKRHLIYSVETLKILHHVLDPDAFGENFCQVLQNKIQLRTKSLFDCQDLELMKENITSFAVPLLQWIEAQFGQEKIQFCSWNSVLVKSILEMCLPIVDKVISSQEVEGSLTFNLFLEMRKLQKFDSSLSDNFYRTFMKCLYLWSVAIKDKAKKYMTNLLEGDIEVHKDQSWVGFGEVDNAWKENFIFVEEIFHMCQMDWQTLDWPMKKVNLLFGTNLLGNLQEIFEVFFQSYYGIVTSDDNYFEKFELVYILNCIDGAMKSMAKMFSALNHLISGAKESVRDVEVSGNVKEFNFQSQKFQQSAEGFISEFVDLFAAGEVKKINSYIYGMNIINKDDDSYCLLGYIDDLLRFFSDHLNSQSGDSRGSSSSQQKTILFEKMFDVLDSSLVAFHDKKLLSRLNFRNRSEKLDSFFFGLVEYLKFRGCFSVSESKALTDIHNSLQLRYQSTPALICRHLRNVQGATEEAELSAGILTFSLGLVSLDQEFVNISVKLLSIRDIKNREDRAKCHPSLSVSLYPGFNETQQSTKIYEEVNAILFDLYEKGPHQFMFKVRREGETLLVVELFDNSQWKTHKVLLGLCCLELQIADLGGPDQAERIEKHLRPVPKACLGDQDLAFKELRKRSLDFFSKNYVNRMEKYANEGRIPRLTSRKHWLSGPEEDAIPLESTFYRN